MADPNDALREYVEAVTRLVDECTPTEELVASIAPHKKRLIACAGLVPRSCFEGLDEVPYTRNLLHADEGGRFTVMAVVWGAGRATPVHDHETWGVVGAYEGQIDVTDYASPCTEDGHLDLKGNKTLVAGDVCCIVPPRIENIHKMHNSSAAPTVTIHTYGDPALRCRIYDPASGSTTDRSLRFHNLP